MERTEKLHPVLQTLHTLKATLRKVHPAFLIAAVIAAVWIEWVLIAIQSYDDFSTPWVGFLVYLTVAIVSIIFLRYLFDIKYKTVLSILTANNLILIIPIGTVISLATGYTLLQLLSPEWEFTHDFVYVMFISQLVVTAILLFGLWWKARKSAALKTVVEEYSPDDSDAGLPDEGMEVDARKAFAKERVLTNDFGFVNESS